MDDKDFISNDYSEVAYTAEKLGVTPSDIYKAKEVTGSNLRYTIEKYIKEHYLKGDAQE